MLSNAYFLAKFRFDTAENEPAKNLQNFRKMHFSKMHFSKMHFLKMHLLHRGRLGDEGRGRERRRLDRGGHVRRRELAHLRGRRFFLFFVRSITAQKQRVSAFLANEEGVGIHRK